MGAGRYLHTVPSVTKNSKLKLRSQSMALKMIDLCHQKSYARKIVISYTLESLLTKIDSKISDDGA